MKQLGFQIFYRDGEFWYSDQPIDQGAASASSELQEGQAKQQLKESGILAGDGEGPPERDSLRREDPDVGASKDEVELASKESARAAEV